MSIHVVNEAKRCLNCKKPQCRVGCPIETQIPQMIELFLKGELMKAGEMLFENNPLSIVCSLICDHDKQCEGHCILNKKGMPVHISSIENYISTAYFDRMKLGIPKKNGIKAAIIGSGPAGITIAVDLAQKGYDVTIFESKDKIGGVLRYGIPEFRLPKAILEKYLEKLKEMGIKIRPNTVIGLTISVDDLIRDGYKSIFIGTGVWKPNRLRIKGETLGHVHFGINYLSNPDVYDLGEKVVIIGAGNAAMDVARTVLRNGTSNVTVYSRTATAAASPREVEYAKIDGVEFEYEVAPVEITDDGVIFRKVKVDENENVIWEDKETFFRPADSVIISVSQGARNRIVSTTTGIEVNERGLLVTDGKGETTRAGIFASGDVVLGAKTVVEAVKYSKTVAAAMDEYMQKFKDI
ncbi:NAD(P)-dependent oxidoreductase [Anaerobium acetethylicum]|uniref:Glutamate synthase (NADPH/NADH) small chain n=1 Tax=Anaerobium acetethylicum TaxID=1619234 RepID=A0A1D3TPB0_9FIRM|nr:NAD(P)-dependent oxidoreductase [Anaerobium acetethylicum]SCP95250.1 glutamate synthase (NADPH/NADH) small chain [Anaerobium acetethylicum]